jgi:pimeloyl-ACP methyl ester carboxylesterase
MRRLILVLLTSAVFAASPPAYAAVKTIVLVHGAFIDGSGWKPVADILRNHGYSVQVVQVPETSFAADVAATLRVLENAGPCVLVGNSYGGMIITEAGTQADVKALVYVAAMQPDVGESLSDLEGKMPGAAKTFPSRSRGLWQFLRYRFQLKHSTRRPRLRLGNKSQATQ